MCSVSYKRIINEYGKYYNEIKEKEKEKKEGNFIVPFNDKYKNYINDFVYKIITLNNEDVLVKAEIKFRYSNEYSNVNSNELYNVTIYYAPGYPFNPPSKITVNNFNIFKIYNIIMSKNKDIVENCMCCESLLCKNNWFVSNNINDIMKEVTKVIKYKQLYQKRILLNKIIEKYTNQDMSFLHNYLL